jgi:hypothetical protein
MQEQSTCSPEQDSGHIEQAVYALLTVHDEQRPWSLRELELELGDRTAVEDSVRLLQAAALVHRCGEFVWATRAAMHAERISL